MLRVARLACTFGWIFALASCADPAGKCTLGTVADLPVTRDGYAYLTDIKINGAPVHLQVDTGAFTNLLGEDTAVRLGMFRQVLFGVAVGGIGHGARYMNLATSNTIQLGAARAAHISFATVEQTTFSPREEGLLGMDFLAHYDDDLDLAAGHLRLVQATGDCRMPATGMQGTIYSVPLDNDDVDGVSPVISVTVNGVRLKALIDTGAGQSLLYRRAAARIGLNVDELLVQQKDQLHGVLPRPARGANTRLHVPVQLGDLRITGLPVSIADQNDIDDHIDMLLGYDFVSLVHVWVSHSSRTLLMEYPYEPTPAAAR